MDETIQTNPDVQVDAVPEQVDTPVEAPVEETPTVESQPVEIPDTSVDIAPEDVPVVHQDDGSVGRELDHVVQQ